MDLRVPDQPHVAHGEDEEQLVEHVADDQDLLLFVSVLLLLFTCFVLLVDCLSFVLLCCMFVFVSFFIYLLDSLVCMFCVADDEDLGRESSSFRLLILLLQLQLQLLLLLLVLCL